MSISFPRNSMARNNLRWRRHEHMVTSVSASNFRARVRPDMSNFTPHSLGPRGSNLGGYQQLSWIVAAYLIASTIGTPIYVKLSDTYGRRHLRDRRLSIFRMADLALSWHISQNGPESNFFSSRIRGGLQLIKSRFGRNMPAVPCWVQRTNCRHKGCHAVSSACQVPSSNIAWPISVR